MRDAASRGQWTVAIGVFTPVLFVLSFLLQELRPGFDPLSQFVSELSIGRFGWLQMVTFFVTGAGFLAYGGLVAWRPLGSRARPILYIVMGISLAMSGVFTTDPSAMFDQTSTPGVIHGLLGAVVFTMFPVICFVYYRTLRTDGRRWVALLTLATGILLVVGIAALKVSELSTGPLFEVKGLIQRVILVLFMGWSAATAAITAKKAA